MPSITSILLAAGTLGRPGIVIMSPLKATINPAPIEGFSSRIVTLNPLGLTYQFVLLKLNKFNKIFTHKQQEIKINHP